MMIIVPERIFQKNSGTLIKIVLTFKRNVNAKTEIPREQTTIIAFFLLNDSFESVPPTITGRRGSTHGVKTVITPAKKEIHNKIMIYVLFLITFESVILDKESIVRIITSSIYDM